MKQGSQLFRRPDVDKALFNSMGNSWEFKMEKKKHNEQVTVITASLK